MAPCRSIFPSGSYRWLGDGGDEDRGIGPFNWEGRVCMTVVSCLKSAIALQHPAKTKGLSHNKTKCSLGKKLYYRKTGLSYNKKPYIP